jgi:CBS domain containing-hemolysin-like protein
MIYSVLVIIGFLFLSAFFSGSETAFFSLTKIQLKKLEKLDSKSWKRIYQLLGNPRELLIIILLGNTIVNVAASSTAALIAIELVEKNLTNLNLSTALTIEIVLMTILLLIFGEITPKLVAFSSPQKLAIFSSFFLVILKYLLWPVIKILEFLSRLFSRSEQFIQKHHITTEDFKNLINSKTTSSSLEDKEKKIIYRIFRFSSTIAREIMTPRVDIVAMEQAKDINFIIEKIMESGHSKIPIYQDNIDNILGVIYAKDLILNPSQKDIKTLLRSPIFITENTKIHNLLNQFKTKKIQIAIVVDEYGGTSGLITLEDVLEELVGEILDEYDKEKPPIMQTGDREWLVSGMMAVAESNEQFDLNIDNNEYDNLADFLYDNFNKVPSLNDSFVYNNKVEFQITQIMGHRIQYAKMKLLHPSDEEK